MLGWIDVESDVDRDFPHKEITRKVIDAFYQVYRELGYGFSEAIYRRGTVIVLRDWGLDVVEEQVITVTFRGVRIGTFYGDIVVAGVVLVEVKAAASMENYAQAQLLNYLKAAGGGVGMLLNFGREPTHKRFVMGDASDSLPGLRGQL